MSEKPISPLRRRMIEDMSVRNFVEKTRHDYIRQVRTFTAFLGRSPDTATAEDLRRFQLHPFRPSFTLRGGGYRTGWRTQSMSNPSLHPNSLLTGKRTGNFAIPRQFPPNDFEAFQPNSLNIGTRNICERTGNFRRHSGNFQRPREEPAMPVGPFVNRSDAKLPAAWILISQ